MFTYTELRKLLREAYPLIHTAHHLGKFTNKLFDIFNENSDIKDDKQMITIENSSKPLDKDHKQQSKILVFGKIKYYRDFSIFDISGDMMFDLNAELGYMFDDISCNFGMEWLYNVIKYFVQDLKNNKTYIFKEKTGDMSDLLYEIVGYASRNEKTTTPLFSELMKYMRGFMVIDQSCR